MSSLLKTGIAGTAIALAVCAALLLHEVTALAQSQRDNTGKQNQPMLRPTGGQNVPAEKMIIELGTGETEQPAALARSEGKLARRFELKMASVSMRYQFIRWTPHVELRVQHFNRCDARGRKNPTKFAPHAVRAGL